MTPSNPRPQSNLYTRLYDWWVRHIYGWHLVGMIRDRYVPPHTRVGKHTYALRRHTIFRATGDEEVEIGSYCSIAEGVRFIFGEHALNHVSTYPLRTNLMGDGTNTDAFGKGAIVVGSDVWIGINALVMSGVTIGHGAVVAAAAVVTRDVPPYAVVAGVPARVIKYRFSPEQIERLLAIAWWDWPEEKIKTNMDLFYGDVDAFIAAHAAQISE